MRKSLGFEVLLGKISLNRLHRDVSFVASMCQADEFRMWSTGCARGACGEGVPVLIPGVAVHDGAESGHAVDSTDFPAGSGLFQSTADQIFARSLDQAAAD